MISSMVCSCADFCTIAHVSSHILLELSAPSLWSLKTRLLKRILIHIYMMFVAMCCCLTWTCMDSGSQPLYWAIKKMQVLHMGLGSHGTFVWRLHFRQPGNTLDLLSLQFTSPSSHGCFGHPVDFAIHSSCMCLYSCILFSFFPLCQFWAFVGSWRESIIGLWLFV